MKTVLYMAPIMGVTGCIYRNVYSRFFKGYDIAVMPFINNTRGKRSSLRDVLPERNDTDLLLVPQILEKHPKNFVILANKLYDLGYTTVNWNLGCPLPMVRNKKKGSGLLSYPGEIIKFLEKILPEIPAKVSIKVRLGAEHPEEFAGVIAPLNNFPLKEIIIHPRTGKQMYKGVPDMDAFEALIPLTKHPIVYSGDINSTGGLSALRKRFPRITRWMIGRGGITNPFLAEEIKGLLDNTPHEKLSRFLSFHKVLLEEYRKELNGPAHLIGKMKEAWRYWSGAFRNGEHLFIRISRTKTVEDYSNVIERFFQEENTGKKKAHPFLL